MNAVAPTDLVFFVLAPVAALAGLASVLQPSLRRAANATLVASIALALLWARAGAAGPAALQLALATTAAGALVLEPSVLRGVDGDRARLLRRAAPPVLAWLVLVLRVVLMTRWPVASPTSAAGWPLPGLVPFLVLGATMLALALVGAASRRSLGGVALAIPLAGSGVATILVALSRMTGAAEQAGQLAAAAVVSSWVLPAVAIALGRGAPVHADPDACANAVTHADAAPLPATFATDGLTVAVAMALALLAGTW